MGFAGKERVEIVVLPELRLCRLRAMEAAWRTWNP